MSENEALEIVKQELKPPRYAHTLRVVEESETLAKRFGANVEKAREAAIWHDYAKYRSLEEMTKIVYETDIDDSFAEIGGELLHAPVGSYLVKTEQGICDEDVLKAIRSHTTGRKDMSLLEKVVFLADYIEPGRSFPGLQAVREEAERDLDEACLLSIKNTITFLVNKQQPIHPDTFHAYNDFALRKLKGRN
ncbi:bis(5'-nucleosyl)-tetraphosphatase (symmetrical) YqeK [Texcoconibacillus texcoconensis]|uniref:bis(5'-nucleosyl)-tetraphosphatase (symmetrical) n=1 Tax=Texcoconibacillus texcoconensis TaxID=1095777 RepID=A0A840QRJ4_9BACI|nr:bis(5'-nucleosyl)-tetraphosphatase (symmetrical) YqeK [Texcoconibacillus texcoconensis]MBB5173969.1 putative HD superfamily hydrolase involved in NAD metabolism [Texcoconibacillus texcoconensis]